MKISRKLQIGVIGPAESEYSKDSVVRDKVCEYAEKVGELLAEQGAIVITGGCDGVMSLACKGAKNKGGITAGTPGRERNSSNEYVDVEILTPIDVGDYLFAGVTSCDAFIALPGGAGTLAEVCLAYRYKKPIIIIEGLSDYYDGLIDGFLDESKMVKILGAKGPDEAVAMAISLARIELEK